MASADEVESALGSGPANSGSARTEPVPNSFGSVPAWDKRDEESPQAFEAFCLYRDAGTARALLTVWRQQSGNETATKTPGKITAWSAAHDWVERAAAYDRYLEGQARRLREELHLKNIEEFQSRQRRLSAAAMEASIRLLNLANKRLKKAEEAKDGEDEITMRLIPTFYATAAAIARAATAAEAEALGLDELLQTLNDDEENSG